MASIQQCTLVTLGLLSVGFGLYTCSAYWGADASFYPYKISFEELVSGQPHDMTLGCSNTALVHHLFNLLKTQCGIVQDGLDDGANYFVSTQSYGHSFLKIEHLCAISWHTNFGTLTDCINNVLIQNTPRTFTLYDGTAIAAMFTTASTIVLGIIFHCRSKASGHLRTAYQAFSPATLPYTSYGTGTGTNNSHQNHNQAFGNC